MFFKNSVPGPDYLVLRIKEVLPLKIFEFINVISDAFATEILPDCETGKVTDKLKYETVLTWFISYEADEMDAIKKALVKSTNFCNKLLNGNIDKDMPITDAAYLKSKISSEGFEEIFDSVNLEQAAVDSLIQKFADYGEPISEFEIVEDITNVLYKLLDARSSINKKGSIRNAVFIGDNKLQIGKKVYNLPEPLRVPNLPTHVENKYVNALFEVYSQNAKKSIVSLSDLDAMPIYKTNLQFHRESFYSAESVLHQIRDFFNDSIKEFENMKQEVFDAIKYNVSLPFTDGFEKLNTTMDIVIKVSFRKSFLSKPGNGLVGPDEQRGMVHMLVNDGKVTWV